MAGQRQGGCPERAQRVEGLIASHRQIECPEPLDFARGSLSTVEGPSNSLQPKLLTDRTGRCHRRLTMPYVYILRCSDNSLYIGETDDLDARVKRHNDGTACAFTSRRRPVALVYSEVHQTCAAALNRERQLKGWTGAKKEALIAGDSALLNRL